MGSTGRIKTVSETGSELSESVAMDGSAGGKLIEMLSKLFDAVVPMRVAPVSDVEDGNENRDSRGGTFRDDEGVVCNVIVLVEAE